MQEISSKIDVLGKKYIENYASMKKIILELESHFELSKNEGSKEKIKRARKRNKLLAREKIELLLDKNKPFVELMSLAGLKHENGFGAGGTTVVILGYVSGVLCLINANVATRKAGAIDYATSLKNLRLSQTFLLSVFLLPEPLRRFHLLVHSLILICPLKFLFHNDLYSYK